MNEPLSLAFAFAAGVLLGAMFYGGLWWTVHRAVSSKRVALWFLGSLLLRMGLALAGFYFVAGGDWQRLLLCLLGFVIARLVGDVADAAAAREPGAADTGGQPCTLAPTASSSGKAGSSNSTRPSRTPGD